MNYDIDRMADILKALSETTRLKLLSMLADCHRGNCRGPRAGDGQGPPGKCVNALSRRLGITASAVSQHLRILRQAGLVKGMRRGPFVHYSLDQETISEHREAFRNTLPGLGIFD